MYTCIYIHYSLLALYIMQVQTMVGEGFTCTPEFWAKISTIKIAEELSDYLTTLDVCYSEGSRQVQSLCWVKERVATNASNATEAVVVQPLKLMLQRITCSSD